MDDYTTRQIWELIEKTTFRQLKNELVRKALEYAHLRAEWFLLDLSSRKVRDRDRILAHDAFIDACNILSRNMAKAGESNCWRALLGDDRKEIGDFACRLHALLAMKMR